MHVVDTHAHFWDVEHINYPWIEAGSVFDRSFLLADYQARSAGAPIRQMVFVECDAHPRCSVQEAEWVTALAAEDRRIQAIVARTSLLDDDRAATLDHLGALPLLRGIRDNIQNNPAGFAVAPRFVEGVQEVHRRGLHFELCLTHHQLRETIELVDRCPDGQFVLDHCAKPDIASVGREPWATEMAEMAERAHVVCKISGLITEADWHRWTPDDILWYARTAAELFGPDRILFGSDWPVSEAAGGFMTWFRLADALVARWSEGDRDKFFRANAQRVYRLAPE
ncbi:amidohydrolase family protein [Sphingopyxis terrae]|jgi:L-fuconolactonase|uniref:L-fuconolactonase n=1 Tax=Sphingopyxis terrae subsp. ummariensis TaxID=429001 RepID=A0A1Y6FN79_9SPHN|nr:amidohydrolase family protein [Sphingopyxis terrae]SMQ76167.1 L-fuconolactonase [Sphingopyxis terrae subsp. ummariensis]